MKRTSTLPTVFILLLLSMLLLALTTRAQTITNNPVEVVSLEEHPANTLTLFEVRQASGKVYLHWLVKQEFEDGLFIIERSNTLEYFEVIGTKKGIGSNIEAPLAYYFTDKTPLNSAYYRITKVHQSGTYYRSPVIKINMPVEMDLASKNKSGQL